MKANRMIQWSAVLAAGLSVIGFGFPAVAETAAAREPVRIDVGIGKPYMLAGQKQTNYVRVALTGLSLDEPGRRTSVNVAIVLDKSGSMAGDKIRKAKDAALAAIDRLGPNDIVSVIAFDDKVEVLTPATKVSDRQVIRAAIERIQVGGSTALFAGVSKGAAEVRKFVDRQRVNRVILLSDGQANVGPSSPSELGSLGASLIKEGVSVTTMGLGLDYNENLMTQLAQKSDGNHYFIERSSDLVRQFGIEFDDVLSVVAQEVTVRITCAEGVRPIRLLGREGDITGQTATTYVNQVYGRQEKYVLLEVEVPAGREGTTRSLASVAVSYVNMGTKMPESVTRSSAVVFTGSSSTVESKADPVVMASAVEQIAVERSNQAVSLRDQGKIEEARRVLLENAEYLNSNAGRYNSKDLAGQGAQNARDASNLGPAEWDKQRKEISGNNNNTLRQQGQAPR